MRPKARAARGEYVDPAPRLFGTCFLGDWFTTVHGSSQKHQLRQSCWRILSQTRLPNCNFIISAAGQGLRL